MGKIMLNGKQYGVGGITDASDIKYGSTDVESALDALNNGLTYNSITTLVNGSVPVSGTASWQYVNETSIPNFDTYKKIIITCGSHGALYNTIEYDAKAMKLQREGQTYTYWDAGNLGTVVVNFQTGTYRINAKTQSLAYDYTIKGIK